MQKFYILSCYNNHHYHYQSPPLDRDTHQNHNNNNKKPIKRKIINIFIACYAMREFPTKKKRNTKSLVFPPNRTSINKRNAIWLFVTSEVDLHTFAYLFYLKTQGEMRTCGYGVGIIKNN